MYCSRVPRPCFAPYAQMHYLKEFTNVLSKEWKRNRCRTNAVVNQTLKTSPDAHKFHLRLTLCMDNVMLLKVASNSLAQEAMVRTYFR
jgi:hypothetical protein